MVEMGNFEKSGRKIGRAVGQQGGELIGGTVGEETGKRAAESMVIASHQPYLLHRAQKIGGFIGKKGGEKIGGELGKKSFEYTAGKAGRAIDRLAYTSGYFLPRRCRICGHLQHKRVGHLTKCTRCRRGLV